MKSIFYFSFIIIFCITSCKKYEEGPCFSLRSKDNRICNNWDIDFIYIDGIDSTNYLTTIVAHIDVRSKDKKCYIDFYDKINRMYLFMKGNWQWSNAKKQIIMQFNYQYDFNGDTIYNTIPVGPIKPYNTVIFDIVKLKYTDCILETRFNNKTYKLIMANYRY